jgi:hypothetical protein
MRKNYVFYNTVTGEIYAVNKLTQLQAEQNCGLNRAHNMMCKPIEEISGSFFSVKATWYDIENNAFVPKIVRKPGACDFVKTQRNMKLKGCDWTQAPDSPLSAEKKAEWATYRQALRDLDYHSCTNANNMVWPTPPA